MRKIIASSLAAAALFFALAVSSGAPARAADRPLPATPETIAAYATVLHHLNPSLPTWQSRDLARHLLVNAERWRLDANMLAAIVTVESRWHTHAVSRAGAIGLGQLMPGTAALLGVDPHVPSENLSGAAEYLANLMRKFGTHYDLVFAAYNAGPRAVVEYGGIPPFYETQHYVVKVMSAWQALRGMVHLPTDVFADIAAINAPDAKYWLDGNTDSR